MSEAVENFAKLAETKKIIRLEKAINELLKTGHYQLELLNRYHKSDSEKEIGFDYFYRTLNSSWECVKFSISLGKGKYRYFSFFPARLLLENIFRLEYYINQGVKGQNEICFWEMARVMKRFYDEFGSSEFKVHYDKLVKDLGESGVVYPNINEDKAYKDPFPSIEKLILQSKLPNSQGFYTHYRFLSEQEHGKLISLYMSEHDIGQYRRCLFYIFLLSKWLLLIVDSHIQNATKDMVNASLAKTDNIMFPVEKGSV